MNKTTLDEAFWTLKLMGVVRSEREFSMQVLKRSESYVRRLRFARKQPNCNVLAVCAEQLERQAARIQSADEIAGKQLNALAKRCYDDIRRIAQRACAEGVANE